VQDDDGTVLARFLPKKERRANPPLSSKTNRKRSTKSDTKVRAYAAIAYKIEHPQATKGECAKAAQIPPTTLGQRAEWQEWFTKIEQAAASGKMGQLTSAWDKRMGKWVAVEE
jgi:hypothetical protein